MPTTAGGFTIRDAVKGTRPSVAREACSPSGVGTVVLRLFPTAPGTKMTISCSNPSGPDLQQQDTGRHFPQASAVTTSRQRHQPCNNTPPPPHEATRNVLAILEPEHAHLCRPSVRPAVDQPYAFLAANQRPGLSGGPMRRTCFSYIPRRL